MTDQSRYVEYGITNFAKTDLSVFVKQIENFMSKATGASWQFSPDVLSKLESVKASIAGGVGGIGSDEGAHGVFKFDAEIPGAKISSDSDGEMSAYQFTFQDDSSFNIGVVSGSSKVQNGVDSTGNPIRVYSADLSVGPATINVDTSQLNKLNSTITDFSLSAQANIGMATLGRTINIKVTDPNTLSQGPNYTPIPTQNILDGILDANNALQCVPINGSKLNYSVADSDYEYSCSDSSANQYPTSEEAYNFFDNLAITKSTGSVTTDAQDIQNAPIQELKPTNVKINHADGTSSEYVGVDDDGSTVGEAGGALTKSWAGHMGSDLTSLNASGIDATAERVNGKSYYDANAQVGVPDALGEQYFVKVGQLVNMVSEGAAGFAKFTEHVIVSTIKGLPDQFESQAPALIGQIVSGLLQGRELDDIIKPLAAQLVASGAMDSLVKELLEQKDANGNPVFSTLAELQADHAMALGAAEGALAAIAVTAILNGKNAGFEDYARAASTASVQFVITNGIKSEGYKVLTDGVTEAIAADGTTKVVPASLTPAGAGVATAVVALASSLIMGQDLNLSTVRNAAVAGANATAGAIIATAVLTYAGYGTAVGGPIGTAIGAVIGVVLGIAEASGFGIPAQTEFHHETIGSVVQGDTIYGLREGGSLLMAKAGVVNAIGTEGADVLVGNELQNALIANGGDDYLEGRANDDALIGGMGNDHAEGGDGNDYIDGGDGHDGLFGDAGNDSILGGAGDDIISGGAGNDSLEGNEGNDVLLGNSGNDIITGGNGDDYIDGGAGDDVADGGAGNDVIDGNIGNDELHGGDGADLLFGGDGNDTVHGDAGDDIVYGDAGIDILYGDSGDDIIDGGKGDDLIFGGLGKDILFGDDGVDFVFGELGDDYIVGGKGDDMLDGGEGNDVFIFNKGDGKDTVADSGGTQDIIRLSNYTLAEVTFIKSGNDLIIRAGDGSDQVTVTNQLTDKPIESLIFSDGTTIDLALLVIDANGHATYNLIADASAMITQATYAGTWQEADADRSFMETNTSSSWYSNNFDTSVMTTDAERELYNDVQTKVSVTKHRNHAHTRTYNTYDYYDYFETNLAGTNGPDRIVGAYWAETINGLGSNDQLYGNGGTDTINGGTEHDMIFGGSENDIIHGNEGNDKIYGDMGDDNLSGDAGNDTLYGEWGNDTVSGGAGDDYVSGGTGDDALSGDAGNDIIIGDAGNDNIQGGDGNDYVVGGDGNDTMYGGAGDDYMSGGSGTDYLDGGDGNDVLRGDDSNDTLLGGAGDDLLVGGKGTDAIDGASGNDTASYAESDSGVTVNLVTGAASGGYATGDTIVNVENVTGSDYNDTLTGDGNNNLLLGGYGNDTLYGGGGNDTLEGGAGADYLDGGAGYDSVSYDDSVSGVEINLVTGRGKFGFAEGDTFVGMEHIIGSKFDDKFIIGSAGYDNANSNITFEGGAGDDTAVLGGNVADYNIILDGTKYIIVRKSDNVTYTFPDIEKVQFNDRTLAASDFPGNGDGVVSIIQNNTANGIITSAASLASAGNTTSRVVNSLQTNAAHGSVVINNDGTYTYTPTNGYLGGDSFKIRLVDQVSGLVRIESVSVIDEKDYLSNNGVLPVLTFRSDIPKIGKSASGASLDRLSNDNIASVWTEMNSDGSHKNHIVVSISDKNGVIKELSLSHADPVDRVQEASVSALKNGGFVVTYTHVYDTTGPNYDVYAYIIDNNGNVIKPEFIVNTYDNYGETGSTVTSLENGNFVVSWMAYQKDGSLWGTYLQMFDSQGSKLGNEIQVNTKTIGEQRSPAIKSTRDGGFVVAFNDFESNTPGVYIQRFDQNATKIGDNIYVGRGALPSLTTLNNGNVVITYASDYGPSWLYVNLYDGSNLLKSVMVNQNYINQKPSVTQLDDGGFVLVWEKSEGNGFIAYSQRFDELGNAIGEPYKINDLPGYELNPKVINIGNNEYAVTWTGVKINSQGVHENGVYETIFNTTSKDLEGSSANDILQSGSGNDTLTGRAGSDVLDGGIGSDTASYADSKSAVTVDLSATSAFNGGQYAAGHGGDAEGDRLVNIENITGSTYNDTLTGDANNNHLDGGAGDDILAANGGNDVLLGGAGNDNISGGTGDDNIDGGEGNDTITAGTGNDTITAGAGLDTVIYSGASSGYSIVLDGQTITVTDTDASNGDDGTDTITGIEQLNFANASFTTDDFPHLENGTANVLKNTAAKGILGDAVGETFSLKTAAVHGNVVFNQDGTYTYTPVADYVGSDVFSYVVMNSLGLGKIVSVNLNVSIDAASNETTTIGSTGNASVATGLGYDTIILGLVPNTHDIITDFDVQNDKIDLSDYNFMLHSFGELKSYMRQQGVDTVIDFGNGQTLVLQNVAMGSLGQNNFIGNVTINNAPTAINLNKSDLSENVSGGVVGAVSISDIDINDTHTYVVDDNRFEIVIDQLGVHQLKLKDGVSLDYEAGHSVNVNITATDAGGLSVTKSFTVVVNNLNEAPIASNINANINEDSQYVISVANLLAQSGAVDIDGDALTISSVQGATNGSVAISNGNVIFTPNTNYNGVADFTFTVSDGNGGSVVKTANLTVSPVNDAPTASNINTNINEDSQYVISVASLLAQSGAVDIDGDALTISSVQGATNGSVAINNGNVIFTPTANYNGAASFTYMVSDGNGGTVLKTANITVAAVNDAPTANNIAATINEDNKYIVTAANLLTASGAIDVDLDTLTISSVQGASNGTVSLVSGSVTFTPNANYNGAASFTYTVNDGKGGTVIKTANLTVAAVNDAPVGAAIAAQAGRAGNALSFTLPAFSDVDNAALTYSAKLTNGTALPSWLAFNATTRTFSGTPPTGVAATVAIAVTASDGKLAATQNFNLNIATNTISGGTANDTLNGTATNDIINGGDGNDTIYGGAGADNINGGNGIDAARYDKSTAAVVVNLATNVNTGGDAAGDKLTLIEQIYGSNYNDSLTGGAAADTFYGNAGNDTINGGDGNDVIYGGAGADVINGGNGIDAARYDTSTAAVTINLATNVNTGGDAAGDKLTLIEQIYGSNYNDSLTGGTAADTFYGNGGNDTINGGDGNDVIYGGAGADVINGGNGIDAARYDTSTAAVTVNLGTNVNTGGDAAGDKLALIEQIYGSNYNDSLTGGTAADTFYGNGGNDTINGGDGNDVIYGGAGADVINGGNGIDAARYDTSTAAVTINLATNVNTGGDAAGDKLTLIEEIYGSNYNDSLTGSALADTLYGNGGNDTINGGAGNDAIFGGLGADLLTGSTGNDSFNFTAITDSKQGAYDTITDFTIGQDKIDLHLLKSFGIDIFSDLKIVKDTAHSETIITANDTAHPGAIDHFELHIKGIMDLHTTDIVW
jgi:Ca2+-binding RTX toxin-like protein